MADIDLESLTSPLAGDAPCGANLEYEPAFLSLLTAAAGRPEQQYGDTVIPGREPDWPVVREQALALCRATRDLRLAVWLTRSGARLEGFAAAVRGLELARLLLERHWEHVHPQLDASDGNDPTARLNALMPLLHPGEGLADLRAARLGGGRAAVTVRDIELALGRAEALPGEAVPTEEGVLQGVATALAATPALRERMQAGVEAVQGMARALDAQLGAGRGPDFTPLLRLLQRVAEAARRVQPAAEAAAPDASQAAVPQAPAPAAAAVGGVIASREDAMRALQCVCEWIETHEPSNPAPLLIRRAQGLMSKSFIDIIRDLAPDGLGQVQKLAGIGKE
ncbi:type VI secretion system protein TssA [Azohydromonas caseinilytica]|uniref:Type VI secretion system protein TssA n=1 Tax=Azohydromonas caseinilytica TaxID=2728836 RepID=A0A848FAI7_9BURK|nr:type VI secretion system protein TssA [Azohydromonas caseinilytica]NML16554.1 type VI secretion system protein TssA [Azohydromonas caseinilytica]